MKTALLSFLQRVLRINKPSEVDWISGEVLSEESPEPLPMFREGDSVILYNPYEGEFFSRKWALYEPERYVIIEVSYDRQEEVFRYLLEDGGEDADGNVLWYSEEWLSLPPKTSFTTKRFDVGSDLTIRQETIENAIVVKSVENELREREIDRLLDIMRTGTPGEREAAKAELRKLTERK